MHLLAAQKGTIADGEEAVDLRQSPGDICFLSAADTEIACVALARRDGDPTLRCVNLMQLKHPMSVDMWVERTARHARLVVARLLGGQSYWSHIAETLHATAFERGFRLAVLPGDDKPDPALARYCTVRAEQADALWRCLVEGGATNARLFLEHCAYLIGRGERPAEAQPLLKAGVLKVGATGQRACGHPAPSTPSSRGLSPGPNAGAVEVTLGPGDKPQDDELRGFFEIGNPMSTPTPYPSPQGGGGRRGRAVLRSTDDRTLALESVERSPSPLRGGVRGGGETGVSAVEANAKPAVESSSRGLSPGSSTIAVEVTVGPGDKPQDDELRGFFEIGNPMSTPTPYPSPQGGGGRQAHVHSAQFAGESKNCSQEGEMSAFPSPLRGGVRGGGNAADLDPSAPPSGDEPRDDSARSGGESKRPLAAIVFYRALMQSGQTAPVEALARALSDEGLDALPAYVTSLKDPVSVATLETLFARRAPDVVINLTGFAVSSPGAARKPTVLEKSGAVVLQAVLGSSSEQAWRAAAQGLGPRDPALPIYECRPAGAGRPGVCACDLVQERRPVR